MKITKEQLEKIKKINDTLKDLDPILKERLIDYQLYELFKDDYFKVAPFANKENVRREVGTASMSKSATRQATSHVPAVREFFDEKKPATTTETVAVFGFYLEHYENKAEFSESDISKAYFEARVRKPKVIGQALRDARNIKGYLVEGSKKGNFRLSNIGENLVLHDLPHKASRL